VIEGFYGRPWSWPERERMVAFAAAAGLNLYFHAPKNDPLHRDRWRDPYLPDELERFRRLAALCRRLGVELSVGVSPLGFDYSRASEYDDLWNKLASLTGAGVRSFGILMDDMAPGAVERQVELVNWTLARLREVGAERLTFTPSEYSGSGDSPYLHSLGAGLDPAVDVLWTGPEVCSRELTAAHARAVAATLRRPPLFWDNYPVNDLEMRFDPHLGPLRGRSPDLLEACRGVLWAAGPQPEASRIALLTCAEYASDPAGYDPEPAWERALLAVGGDEADAAAVAVLASAAWRSPLVVEPPLDGFAPAAAEFWGRWEAGAREEALLGMRNRLAGLRAAAERLRALRNRALRRELRPWTEKLVGWVEAAELALAALETGEPLLRRLTLERIRRNRENFHHVLGDSVEVFARRCIGLQRVLPTPS
jgi:hyaluronoglucosaminidase